MPTFLFLLLTLAARLVIHAGVDEDYARYFEAETRRLESRDPLGVVDPATWESKRQALRGELFEMLSLEPRPAKTDLQAVVTSRSERDGVVVENLHFQSMPGLYVTANLYLPQKVEGPLPAILYLSGHGGVQKDGVSYGNKTHYTRHGTWFAQHGYACLTLDTIQLGEILGVHHGTYRSNYWSWNSRGYTPAGVEAWNCIRALDYLETRPEVDKTRFGATGRSGGGAYSWWITALDDRIKVAAPVAGITDLRNYVVDGAVEGHCDCMFTVNTRRWDYWTVAALAAPRPLLIANTDKDSIFPLDGVLRVHDRTRSVYRHLGAGDKLGLLITEGPHQDTQDLQVPVFRWFDRFLKGSPRLVEKAATPLFGLEDLRVFHGLPGDERTSVIHETFVPAAPLPHPPADGGIWESMKRDWLRQLAEKSFAGWPEEKPPVWGEAKRFEAGGMRLAVRDLETQEHIRLPLWTLERGPAPAKSTRLVVLDGESWPMAERMLAVLFPLAFPHAAKPGATRAEAAAWLGSLGGGASLALFAPRGVGPSEVRGSERKLTHWRRRHMLLGQTVDGMRVFDIAQAAKALSVSNGGRPVAASASGGMAANLLYAAATRGRFSGLELRRLPASHSVGPDYLNVLRFMDIPQALALALQSSSIRLVDTSADVDAFARGTHGALGWKTALERP